MDKFYQRILNIDNRDKRDIIQHIVEEEKKELLVHSDDTEGFCKYIANQILCRLHSVGGIKTYLIDLNELISFDHVVLIAEYRNNDVLKTILIDPTFDQFRYRQNSVLLKLQEWPYEKLKNEDFFESLITKGMFDVNEENFNKYLNAFCDNANISLNQYLQNLRFRVNDNTKRR